jgi:putative acetyltransferase
VLDVWRAASSVGHPFLTDEFLASERQSIARDHLPSAETWVWEADGKISGFIALLGDEIGALFVDPALHGEGVGRALVGHARELRGRLEVEVFAANGIGRRFYERCGFIETVRNAHEATGLEVIRMELPASDLASDPSLDD